MISSTRLILSLLAWLIVGLFWLLTTREYHPSWRLALVATGSLVVAYAAASYVNHLVLVSRYLQRGYRSRYAVTLLSVMVGLTLLAMAVLKTIYFQAMGVDLMNSFWVDFGLDLFGMIVHVIGAAVIVVISNAIAD